MSDMTDTAMAFFDACETGKGWDACSAYCTANATFSSQAEPLAEITTLADYTAWMQGLLTILPDGSYELRAFASDEARSKVVGYAVFRGTHTAEGGPVPPTGKKAESDYVYVMDFEGGKIAHMTKIWHSGWALGQLGWA